MQRIEFFLPDSTCSANENLIVVAPHGPDDIYTQEIAIEIYKKTNCYCLINTAFKKCKNPNSILDLADCNNLSHCRQDSAVKSEFYKPLNALVHQLIHRQIRPLVLTIHGCGKQVPQDTFYVAGYGENGNDQSRLTIPAKRLERFSKLIKSKLKANNNLKQFLPYGAKFGSPYNAHSKNNLLQAFRYNYGIKKVEAIQLEFPYWIRNPVFFEDVANIIAQTMEKY